MTCQVITLLSIFERTPIPLLRVVLSTGARHFRADLRGSFLNFFLALFLENLVGISLGMILSACFKNVAREYFALGIS